MTDRSTRRRFLAAGGVATVASLAGCTGLGQEDDGDGGGGGGVSGSLTIFHAGSLESSMGEAEGPFEREYGVDVDREARGSVGSTKKITDEGRSADVLGVSDFRLVRDVMVPDFADWYGVFATNAMTVVYTDDSKYADEFGPDTWWEVLSRGDVTVAHSDPAVDPNGYRSVMAMRLGAKEFDGARLYDRSTAEAMESNAQVGAGTETELIAQVKAGAVDYAWEYRSAGATHDVRTVDLQPHVDLSEATATHAEHYASVAVEAGGTTYVGAPIAYGITVPSVAENPGAGAAWVEYFASDPGREVLRRTGFAPVEPIVVPAATERAVPERVATHAETQASLGPLRLDPRGSTPESPGTTD